MLPELEIELKKAIADFYKLLFLNQIEDLEDNLSKDFYKHFSNFSVFNLYSTDWLLVNCKKVLKY